MKGRACLTAAAVCMEGRALNWYHWMDVRTPIRDWVSLKQAIITRFQNSQEDSAYEALIAMKQEGIVVEFKERFEFISAPLCKVPHELLMGAFVNGLQEETRAEVTVLKPQNLAQAMNLAQRIEDKNLVLDRAKGTI